jgi:hypothetical protein
MDQVLHVPYTLEQVEGGAWRAHARLLSQAGTSGEGRTREEAVADLRAALADLVTGFGGDGDTAQAVDVTWPLPRPQRPRGWKLWSRRKTRRRRQRFSMEEWEPAITGLGSGEQRYIRLRWTRSIELIDKRHRQDVSRFFILRTLSVLGGVTITALSGIGLSGTSSSPGIRWTIFALGFVVAGSAAMEQLGHYNQHRLLSRGAREELLSAGFGYLLPAPDPASFDEFRKNVEQIIGKYNQDYDRTISGP